MLDGDPAAPDVENKITVAYTADMFSLALQTVSQDQPLGRPDILSADMPVAMAHSRKHVAASEQAKAVVLRTGPRAPDFVQQQLKRFVAITAIEGLGRFTPPPGGQHEVRHPSQMFVRVPQYQRYARAEQRADTCVAVAEIQLARREEYLDGTGRFRHEAYGKRMA